MAKSKSSAKQTRDFLKKGLLAGQIKQRHDARAFKQKVKGRQVKRNNGPPPAQQQQDKDSDDEQVIVGGKVIANGNESDSESDSDAELDLDGVLNGDGQVSATASRTQQAHSRSLS